MVSCAANVAKYLFFAFNFIFFVLGIAVLGVGIYSRVENDTWKDLVVDTNTFFAAANLLIAGGVIVAVLGFLGCCGAVKEVKWMLIIYSVLVILIFILEIVGGAVAYNNRETVETKLTEGLTKAVNTYDGLADNTAAKGMSKAMDWFQENVKCCGVNGTADWAGSEWHKSQANNTKANGQKVALVPDSCCKTITAGCGKDITQFSSPAIHQKGCIAAGKTYVKDNLWLVGGVGVGIAVVQLLAIVFAICLICAFRDAEKEGTNA